MLTEVIRRLREWARVMSRGPYNVLTITTLTRYESLQVRPPVVFCATLSYGYTGCTPEQARKVISLRPFSSVDDVETRLRQGKKKAGPAGISPRMFRDCVEILEGYGTVDQILLDCERIGTDIRRVISAWSEKGKEKEHKHSSLSASSELDEGSGGDGALSIVSVSANVPAKSLISKAPSVLSEGVQLKDYQLIGLSWLHLLYSKELSCILADEMGK